MLENFIKPEEALNITNDAKNKQSEVIKRILIDGIEKEINRRSNKGFTYTNIRVGYDNDDVSNENSYVVDGISTAPASIIKSGYSKTGLEFYINSDIQFPATTIREVCTDLYELGYRTKFDNNNIHISWAKNENQSSHPVRWMKRENILEDEDCD